MVSNFEFNFLLSDLLFLGLVLLIAKTIHSGFKNEAIKQKWSLVFKSRSAIISAVIIITFFTIALADCIRFDVSFNDKTTGSNSRTLTLLDLAFFKKLTEHERTYSKPFAREEFNYTFKVVNSKNTKIKQELKYAAKHLDKNNSILLDVVLKIIFSWFAYICSLLLILWFVYFYRHKIKNNINEANNFKKYLQALKADKYKFIFIVSFLTSCFIFITLVFLSNFYNVLGTSKIGEDVLYNSIKSIRTAMLIGSLTLLVGTPIGIFLGLLAGYFKGWVDSLIQYIYTTVTSIPGILLISTSVLMIQVVLVNNPSWFDSTGDRGDVRLVMLIFILGLTTWTGICRQIRAESLKLSQFDFISSARVAGSTNFGILYKHLLPNVMHLVLILLVLDFSGLVLAEAVLSYVGVGVDPNAYSWGNMINQARYELARTPIILWPILSAFSLMVTLVLAVNIFADRIQFVFNPKNY